uniref:Uncharacterized protein n=1 Tax=Anguilla anguilla TaxID=7936 RepID=A0A0E9VA54_ANGAN
MGLVLGPAHTHLQPVQIHTQRNAQHNHGTNG